jgi:hypothetical protein
MTGFEQLLIACHYIKLLHVLKSSKLNCCLVEIRTIYVKMIFHITILLRGDFGTLAKLFYRNP